MVLDKGDTAPDFQFRTKQGEIKNFHGVEGRKVIFFFPRAFTSACTEEACSLQDNYDDLKQEGVTEVFGISMDNMDKQASFGEQYNLEYILVDDTDGEISKSYGVFTRKLLLFKFSQRYTFVVDENNIITVVFENGISGEKSAMGMERHGEEILNFLSME